MNHNSNNGVDRRPILIVPYMWIGDFVRCHTVVKLLNARYPDRPVDMLATTLCAPLADYMPGLRQAIVADLPRSRLALSEQYALAKRLKREGYGTALVMPRTWKSTLAPFFAGIPERTGFAGEARFFLLNDVRYGERALPRMVDRCAALALPAGAKLPPDWPLTGAQSSARRSRGLAQASAGSMPTIGLSWRLPRAPSDRRNVGRAPLTPHSPAASWPKVSRSGCWAAPTKKRLPARSSAIRRRAI